jgi:hypothetical protein
MKSKESLKCKDPAMLILKEYLIKTKSNLTKDEIQNLREKFENSQSKDESSNILRILFIAFENLLLKESMDSTVYDTTKFLQHINSLKQEEEIKRLEEEIVKANEYLATYYKNQINLEKINKSIISKNSKYVMYYLEYEQICDESKSKVKDKFTDEERNYVYDVLDFEKRSGPKFSFGVMVFRNRTNEEFLKVFSSGTDKLDVNNMIMVLDSYENFYSAFRGKKHRMNKNK